MLSTANDTRSRPGGYTRQRLLLGGAAVGLTAFVVTFLVEGALRPGYRPWRHAISQLSLGPFGWVNVIAVLVAGASLLAFAAGLGSALPSGVGSIWGPRLLAVTGACLGLTALLDDPGLGYPPGIPAQQSLHGLLHGLLVTVAIGCLSAAYLVMARRFARDPDWRGWARYSTLTGVVVAAGYMATAVVTGLDQAGVLANAPGGLLQRVMIITGFGWCVALAGRLLVTGKPRPAQVWGQESPVSARWAVAGVVEAPADEVFGCVCAIGPAGSGQLAGPPGPGATTGTDGILRYSAPIGQPPLTTVTVEVDPTRRTLVIQGHWWYHGVHTVTPHPRGSLLAYRVHNAASWGRWMVPLMQWRLPTQMRRDLDQLLRQLGEQLGCAAHRLA